MGLLRTIKLSICYFTPYRQLICPQNGPINSFGSLICEKHVHQSYFIMSYSFMEGLWLKQGPDIGSNNCPELGKNHVLSFCSNAPGTSNHSFKSLINKVFDFNILG